MLMVVISIKGDQIFFQICRRYFSICLWQRENLMPGPLNGSRFMRTYVSCLRAITPSCESSMELITI